MQGKLEKVCDFYQSLSGVSNDNILSCTTMFTDLIVHESVACWRYGLLLNITKILAKVSFSVFYHLTEFFGFFFFVGCICNGF